jgi:hypothetical protein
MIPEDMSIGSEFESTQCGKFKVIKYVSGKLVKVRFNGTGYETTTQSSHIRRGKVRDPYYPTVFGKGYLGVGPLQRGVGAGTHTLASKSWKGMLERCYCPKYQERKPTYNGCTVIDEWLNFQTFATWFYKTHPGDGRWSLDKDLKGSKLYSEDTCTWLTLSDNSKVRHNTYIGDKY